MDVLKCFGGYVLFVLKLPFVGIRKLLNLCGIEVKCKKKLKEAEYIKQTISDLFDNAPCFILINENIGLRLMSVRFPTQKEIEKQDGNKSIIFQLNADQAILFEEIDLKAFKDSTDDLPEGFEFE